MKYYLEQFKNGLLTFDTILKEAENIFLLYENYNLILPKDLQYLKTRDEYIKHRTSNKVVYIDHGWDNLIPLINEKKNECVD